MRSSAIGWAHVPEPLADTPDQRRNFWQRRVRDPIVAQLTQGITPEKIALTVAVGSALALFPILGTTTLLCFLAGVALRLNQPIIQAVNYLCTPIHIPLIFVCVRAGEWLFAAPQRPFKIRVVAKLLWEEPMRFLNEFGATGFHAIVIWAIFVPFWITTLYYTALPILREIARVRLAAVAKLAADKQAVQDEKPPVP